MVYEDYYKVALKHLRTCEYMKDYLNFVVNIQKRDAILRNIYYLSGYIIEGVVNFLIYKTINRNQPNRPVAPLFENISRIQKWVCYNYPNASHRRNNPSLPEQHLFLRITSHKFQANKEIILFKLNTIQRTDFQYIDIFTENPHVRRTNLYQLFKNWSHNDIRYQTNSTTHQNPDIRYNEQDILEFFEFAKETYRILPTLF